MRSDEKVNKLSENLQFLRNKKGMSQFLVASELNMSQQKYSYYETGQREPDIDTLLKLSEYFNVSLDELLKRKA